MADIADVENAIAAAITTAVYPLGGSGQTSAVVSNSIVATCKVYPLWPLPRQLDADMAAPPTAPIVHISVYTQPGMERNTTRFPRIWFDQVKNTSTITATLSGFTITLGGTITAGHYVSVEIGTQNAYSYAALVSDTLSTFATALAALINVNFACTASGPVITLPATTQGRIVVRTAAPGTVIQNLELTNQMFKVTVWAPNNGLRVAAASIIRPALAQIDYLTLPDTSMGRLLFSDSTDMDRLEKTNVYRRDIHYWVEYATNIVMPGYPLTIFQSQITVAGDQAPAEYTANS